MAHRSSKSHYGWSVLIHSFFLLLKLWFYTFYEGELVIYGKLLFDDTLTFQLFRLFFKNDFMDFCMQKFVHGCEASSVEIDKVSKFSIFFGADSDDWEVCRAETMGHKI